VFIRTGSRPAGRLTRSRRPPYQGLDHFGVGRLKDIDCGAAEGIKAKGVESRRSRRPFGRESASASSAAPQGISIELLERDKKYA